MIIKVPKCHGSPKSEHSGANTQSHTIRNLWDALGSEVEKEGAESIATKRATKLWEKEAKGKAEGARAGGPGRVLT